MPPRRRNVNEDRREPEASPPPPPRRIEEMFLRQNPPTFNGTGSPEEAELLVRAMERIFNFLHCTAQERMSCVTFQLVGDADFWWESKRNTLTSAQLENYSWEEFKEGMYEKYIPKSYRRKKETEFYHLKQGKGSVTDYDRAFCTMSRYAPQQVDTEEKRTEKFCSGLRSEIRMTIAGQGQLTYTEALGRALDIEAAMPEEKPAPVQSQQTGDKGKRKWEGNSGGYQQKKPWQGNPTQQNRSQGQVQAQGPKQGQGKPTIPRQITDATGASVCSNCLISHQGAECPAKGQECFNCGKMGHYSRACRSKTRGGNRTQTQQFGAIQGAPQQQ